MDKEFKKLFDDIEKTYYSVLEIEKYSSTQNNPFYKYDLFKKMILELYCYSKEPLNTTKKLNKKEQTIYRGIRDISAKKYVKLLKTGEFTFFRHGILGLGCYFSKDYFYSLDYANNKSRGMVYANIKEDTNFLKSRDVFAIYQAFLNEITDPDNKLNPKVVEFIYNQKSNPLFETLVARAKGIDVIVDNNLLNVSMCILNPKKVTILEK